MKDMPLAQTNWFYRLMRGLIFGLIRLFYPRLEVQGWEKLPAHGPVIFVMNHPNGLIDPILLMLALNRPVAFLAKATFFHNPLGRLFMQAFGAAPVYRREEARQFGRGRERNELTFARCRRLLQQGGQMALFPEGLTHSGSRLRPLRTGAARIALSAEQETGWTLGLQIVPVGLWYQRKTDFRSAALLVVGDPIELAPYASTYTTAEGQTVQALTERLETALAEVVLQAEPAHLLDALPVLATWTTPEGKPETLPHLHQWTAMLLAAYHRLAQSDPARLDRLAQQAYYYAATVQRLGLSDPWLLEKPRPGLKRLARMLLGLGVTLPLGLAGFLLSYLPYRLAGWAALRLTGHDTTQISTFKLIGGVLFMLLGWLVESIILSAWLGGIWGWSLFLAAPFLAYMALHWAETWDELTQYLTAYWWCWRRADLVRSLRRLRRHLAQQVGEAVLN